MKIPFTNLEITISIYNSSESVMLKKVKGNMALGQKITAIKIYRDWYYINKGGMLSLMQCKTFVEQFPIDIERII